MLSLYRVMCFGLSMPVGLLFSSAALALPPMQLFVELTPPGGLLRPPPGIYSGPVEISRPIVLEGDGLVTIDGGGADTVVTVRADRSEIRGLRIVNSGDSHDQMDSGILLEADDALIEDNEIVDVLFGINLRQANGNLIRSNRISSRQTPLSMRGDGLRLWYSSGNLIDGNEIFGVRDILIINSPENRIRENRIHHSRMGIELVFSPGNEIVDNEISENARGIASIYSDRLTIRGNHFLHLHDVAGSALAVKESSQVLIEGNEVLDCAVGLIVNAPVHPQNTLQLQGNRFLYNDVALYFYGEKGGHLVHGNRFHGNQLDVAVSSSSSALANDWNGNYWDLYQGFDRDRDGIGDTPHSLYFYSDRIWMDRPMTRFFRSSPAMEFIDFAERLTSFSRPDLILRDPSPRR